MLELTVVTARRGWNADPAVPLWVKDWEVFGDRKKMEFFALN